jgi:predicted NBD/HSP70 family sugar kinase
MVDSSVRDHFAGGGGAAQFRGTNQSGMRALNEKLILTLLRRHGSLAKSDLTRLTGLSAQTISVIMRSLEGDRLVMRGDPVRGRIGQPSVPLSLDPEGGYFFGLKIGRRTAEIVLINFLGEAIHHRRLAYPYPAPEKTIAFAHKAIAELTGRLSMEQQIRIAGLGIAMPFYLWDWAQALGVPDDTMIGWRSVDMRDEIASRYAFPVYLENDASSACAAEIAFGQHDGPDNFLYFYIGYFIGGGIVLNGALFTGPGGNAGALGPMPVPGRDGKICQLIEVASLSELERQLAASGFETATIWENASCWDIDPDILEDWITSAASGLAHAITAACSIIDFSAVVIDGWIPGDIRTRFVTAVIRNLEHLNMTGLEMPEIREGAVGASARVIGAASLPLFDRFMTVQNVYAKANT